VTSLPGWLVAHIKVGAPCPRPSTRNLPARVVLDCCYLINKSCIYRNQQWGEQGPKDVAGPLPLTFANFLLLW